MFGLVNSIGYVGVDNLPPLHVSASEKKSDKWKQSIMDAFEGIAVRQFQENLPLNDLYRMVDGKMAYQELAQVIPQLDDLQTLLNGAGIPTFLKHYDILGTIVNELVGKFMDLQDKFTVQDVSEVAKNEFLRFKDGEIQKAITALLEKETQIKLAEMGIDVNGRKFASQEEQQAFIAEVEKQKQSILAPEKLEAKQKSFKSAAVQWGEATIDKDAEEFEIKKLKKREFKDYILTGKAFREYKIYNDRYAPKSWDPRTVYHSKELDVKEAHKFQYIGRIHHYTPTEVIREYGHLIPTSTQKKLLGGNSDYKTVFDDGYASGSINTAIQNNFSEERTVPFSGYYDYKFSLGIQDYLGVPMGESTVIHPDGSTSQHSRFLSRPMTEPFGQFSFLSNVLRPDIVDPRKDMCQIVEGYFIAYDLVGYLTYEDENGNKVTHLVTEDIYKDFLKEKGISQKFNSALVDVVKDFPVNTIQWFYTENTYEGVKISSMNLDKPLYYVFKSENQIEGATKFQRFLPVAGIVGRQPIQKAVPYQAKFNLCMNQVWNLLEKELGTVLLMDVKLVPSELDENGDPEDALMNLRQMIKDTSIVGIAPTQDGGGVATPYNNIQTYNLSNAGQIDTRIKIAEYCKKEAFEAVGFVGQQTQPSKYETATGVRLGQEVSYARLADVFDDFNSYERSAYNLHLSVARYAQTNNKDNSLFYTKSDSSIKFIETVDPKLPFVKLGVLSTFNPKKRAELEQFKTMLLQNNTVGSDVLELGKLYLSDDIQTLLQEARNERENKMQQEQLNHQRQQELLQQKAQQDQAADQAKWEREKYKIDMNNQTDVQVAKLQSLGRAANAKEGTDDLKFINQSAQTSLKENELAAKTDATNRRLELDTAKHTDKLDIEKEKLRLKQEELALKKQIDASETYRSTINKN